MKKLFFSAISSLLLGGLLFTSCMPSADGPPPPPNALFNLVNASPKSADLKVSLGGNPSEMDYKEVFTRLLANPGTYKFKVTNKEGTREFLNKDVEFASGKFYSLVLTDTLSKMELVVLKDSIVNVSQDSARIRFANMVPDVEKMDFYIKGQAEPVAKDVSYKTAVEFMRVKSASSVIIEAKASGSNELLGTSEAKEFKGGSINTIFASGFKSLTDEGKIHVGLMQH